jgi:enamine deaminase RidA (YjgF/YER057c/UK114 family)
MTPQGVAGVGDAYAQAIQALRTIEAALKAGGAALTDVVRTRIYLTDMADSDAVGRAHAEFFRAIKPAATMVAVSALIHPDMRVEIEAEAYVG